MIKIYLTKSKCDYVNGLMKSQMEKLNKMLPTERINLYNSSLFIKPVSFTKEQIKQLIQSTRISIKNQQKVLKKKAVYILKQTEK